MVELVNLFWSAAGVFPGEGEVSPYDLVERARSAADAGFSGISFWHADLAAICETRSLQEVRTILDDHGLYAWEVALIEDWFADGARRQVADGRTSFVLEAAEALGARHVKCGDRRNSVCEPDHVANAFAGLCAQAERHGLRVGYEFMKVSAIRELDACLAMVGDVPNGGLIVDIAHTNNIGIPNGAVAAIPPDRIVSVELSDNVRGTDGYNVGARRFCGEGELDVPGFVEAAKTAGYHGPWAVEVVNPALRDWSLDRINQTGYRTTLPYVRG